MAGKRESVTLISWDGCPNTKVLVTSVVPSLRMRKVRLGTCACQEPTGNTGNLHQEGKQNGNKFILEFIHSSVELYLEASNRTKGLVGTEMSNALNALVQVNLHSLCWRKLLALHWNKTIGKLHDSTCRCSAFFFIRSQHWGIPRTVLAKRETRPFSSFESHALELLFVCKIRPKNIDSSQVLSPGVEEVDLVGGDARVSAGGRVVVDHCSVLSRGRHSRETPAPVEVIGAEK